jgi:hypothetical protein
MHKIHSPVLISGALIRLDELDLASQAEEALDHSQAVLKAAQLSYHLTNAVKMSQPKHAEYTWHADFSRLFVHYNRCKDALDTNWTRCITDPATHARIFIGGEEFWHSVISRPVPALDTLSADNAPLHASEPTEVETLRREVDELKRQVTVLTGLVQLRAEPAADPLAAAKSRGASYIKTEFESADNLSLSAASEYSGRSDRMINLERNRGSLYALILEGNTRGYRYPRWQFDVPSARLRSVLNVLTASSISCWSMHNFLMRPHSDLDGRSPSTAIGDSDFSLERIVEVARRRVEQQQGAS